MSTSDTSREPSWSNGHKCACVGFARAQDSRRTGLRPRHDVSVVTLASDNSHGPLECLAEECDPPCGSPGGDPHCEPAAGQRPGLDAEEREKGRVEETRTICVEEALRLISSAESEARQRNTFRPISQPLSPEGRARICREATSSAKCENANVAETTPEQVTSSGAEWVKLFSF